MQLVGMHGVLGRPLPLNRVTHTHSMEQQGRLAPARPQPPPALVPMVHQKLPLIMTHDRRTITNFPIAGEVNEVDPIHSVEWYKCCISTLSMTLFLAME